MNINTRKIVKVGAVALATMMFVGIDSKPAQAQFGFGGFGIHLGGRNVHVDIGNPHGYRSSYGRQSNYGRSYQRYQAYRAPAHLDWHDTSHVDYIPGGYVRHRNHYDYVPGRHVIHREGHYDVHRGGHFGGHH